jgi:hypothetical protein
MAVVKLLHLFFLKLHPRPTGPVVVDMFIDVFDEPDEILIGYFVQNKIIRDIQIRAGKVCVEFGWSVGHTKKSIIIKSAAGCSRLVVV